MHLIWSPKNFMMSIYSILSFLKASITLSVKVVAKDTFRLGSKRVNFGALSVMPK